MRQSQLLFMPLTLQLRLLFSKPSVSLSTVLLCGKCQHLPCAPLKFLSIIFRENFESFLGTATLASFIVFVASRAYTTLSSNAPSPYVREQEPQEVNCYTMSALSLPYTTFGSNVISNGLYWRSYSSADKMCANFNSDVKFYPEENRGLTAEVYYLCTH